MYNEIRLAVRRVVSELPQPAGCKSPDCELPAMAAKLDACNCGAKHSADCMMFWAPVPRPMELGDLYAYRVYGWHQFGWPVLPTEWYL